MNRDIDVKRMSNRPVGEQGWGRNINRGRRVVVLLTRHVAMINDDFGTIVAKTVEQGRTTI